MATTKPRLSISLSPETHHVFTRYAALAGKPTATIIGDLLEEARPHFEQMGVLLQSAQRLAVDGTDQERRKMLAHLELGAVRAQAAAGLIGGDLLAASAAAERDAALPRRSQRRAQQSLIHTNKSPKSTPTRVPARSVKQKRGGKRAST